MNDKKLENYHRIYENASITLYRTPSIPIKGLNRISASFSSYNFIKKILQDNQIDFVLIYSIVTNAKAAIKACNELNIPLVHRTFDIIHDLIRENYLRGKVEKIVSFAIANIAGTLSKLAYDVCLFMSQNFNFVSLPTEFTTGSSIMPHKKTPAVLELTRVRCNKLQGVPSEITLIIKNLPSG